MQGQGMAESKQGKGKAGQSKDSAKYLPTLTSILFVCLDSHCHPFRPITLIHEINTG